MPVRIKLKNSVVDSKAPVASDLEIGELAINAHQNSPAVYLKDAAGAVRKIAGSGAVGATAATTTATGVVQLADAAAVTAGTAGRVVDAAQLKAAVAAEDLWDRTGTEISPKTAGDAVYTSGDVKVGGTTAAPNIRLYGSQGYINVERPTAGNVYRGRVASGQASAAYRFYGDETTNGCAIVNYGATFSGISVFNLGANGSVLEVTSGHFAVKVATGKDIILGTDTVRKAQLSSSGDFLLGGTLPASPNITLQADGLVRAVHFRPSVPDSAAAPGLQVYNEPDTGFFRPTANTIGVAVGGVEAARFTSDQYLRMAAGTKGIQFGGDTAAANALNDYEEGTWTVAITDSVSTATSPTAITGYYIKVGNMVSISFVADDIATTGLAPTGSVYFSLPFKARSTMSRCHFSVEANNMTYTGGLGSRITGTLTRCSLFDYAKAVQATIVPVSALTSGVTDLYVSGVYYT